MIDGACFLTYNPCFFLLTAFTLFHSLFKMLFETLVELSVLEDLILLVAKELTMNTARSVVCLLRPPVTIQQSIFDFNVDFYFESKGIQKVNYSILHMIRIVYL